MAVDHCSLDIPAGEICMIVGPSGCGKTTLLERDRRLPQHHVAAASTWTARCCADPESRRPSPAPTGSSCSRTARSFPGRRISRTSIFGPVMQGSMRPQEGDREGARDDGGRGPPASSTTIPGEVSSGMRRRVEIVRALMNDPKVLLLDEPYRALDSLTKSVMHEALLEIYYKNKVTIFFITHDLEEAIFLGHRLAIMTSRPCRPKKMLDGRSSRIRATTAC